MINQSGNKVKGYLVNDDFVNYIVNPTLTLTEIWNEFFETHPSQIPIANEAKQIILGTNEFVILPKHESDSMKRYILNECGL